MSSVNKPQPCRVWKEEGEGEGEGEGEIGEGEGGGGGGGGGSAVILFKYGLQDGCYFRVILDNYNDQHLTC